MALAVAQEVQQKEKLNEPAFIQLEQYNRVQDKLFEKNVNQYNQRVALYKDFMKKHEMNIQKGCYERIHATKSTTESGLHPRVAVEQYLMKEKSRLQKVEELILGILIHKNIKETVLPTKQQDGLKLKGEELKQVKSQETELRKEKGGSNNPQNPSLENFSQVATHHVAREGNFAILGNYGYENQSFVWAKESKKVKTISTEMEGKSSRKVAIKPPKIQNSAEEIQTSQLSCKNALAKYQKQNDAWNVKGGELLSEDQQKESLKNFFNLSLNERRKIKQMQKTDQTRNGNDSPRDNKENTIIPALLDKIKKPKLDLVIK
jgi:hypothetical protein